MIVLTRFNTNNPFTIKDLNENFAAIVAAVNAMAGEEVVQMGAVGNLDSGGYVPKSGGRFYGQVSAPSLVIGPDAGPYNAAVTVEDAPTGATRGVVLQAAAVADLAQSISNPPTQAEVTAIQDKINDLLTAARAAGWLAP